MQSNKNEISELPFVGSVVANRLSSHYYPACLYNGETMHSFKIEAGVPSLSLCSELPRRLLPDMLSGPLLPRQNIIRKPIK